MSVVGGMTSSPDMKIIVGGPRRVGSVSRVSAMVHVRVRVN